MINIYKWKNSKNPKHKKIFEKAKSIIDRDLVMEDIETDERIAELSEKFPTLSINIIAGGNLTVESIKDEWLIMNDGRFYALHHMGKFMTRRSRAQENYHIQDVFYDIEFLLASIVSHDQYKIKKQQNSMGDIKRMAFG